MWNSLLWRIFNFYLLFEKLTSRKLCGDNRTWGKRRHNFLRRVKKNNNNKDNQAEKYQNIFGTWSILPQCVLFFIYFNVSLNDIQMFNKVIDAFPYIAWQPLKTQLPPPTTLYSYFSPYFQSLWKKAQTHLNPYSNLYFTWPIKISLKTAHPPFSLSRIKNKARGRVSSDRQLQAKYGKPPSN